MKTLVTKLEAVINNSNAPVFGELPIEIVSSSGHNVSLYISCIDNTGTYSIVSGKAYTSNQFTTEMPASGSIGTSLSTFWVKGGDSLKVNISKYKLGTVQIGALWQSGEHLGISFNDFDFCPVTSINLSSNVYYSYITGSLEQFVENQASFREDGNSIVITMNTSVTLNEQRLNGEYTINIGSSECTVVFGGNTIATYNKTTHIWTYA